MKNKSKNNVSTFTLLVIIITGLLFIFTKKYNPKYPSDYVKIAPEVEFPFSIKNDSVIFSIPKPELNKPHIVYAVLDDTLQYGIIDPTLNKDITITPGTLASYVAKIRDNKITEYKILKAVDSYSQSIDLYNLILKANEVGNKFGIQRCLSPFCNICVEECKKVNGEGSLAIELVVDERGKVVPVFYRGYCPRCGRCFKECPIGLLLQSGYFDEIVD